jgi:hypothetical protein
MAIPGMSATLETKWNTLSSARAALAAWKTQGELNRLSPSHYDANPLGTYQQQRATLQSNVATAEADYLTLRATEQAALGVPPISLPF